MKSIHESVMNRLILFSIFVFVLILAPSTGSGQVLSIDSGQVLSIDSKQVQTATDTIVQPHIDKYLDSLKQIKDNLQQLPLTDRYGNRDGRYYRLFVPFTFYHSPINTAISLDSTSVDIPDNDISQTIDNILINAYIHRPDLIVESQKKLDETGGLKDVSTPKITQDDLTDDTRDMPPFIGGVGGANASIEKEIPVEVVIKKPNFWNFRQDYYLQLLQNFFSDNWYKGGEKNYSMLGSMTFEANYNNKQKVRFENKLEMKLGMQTNESDTLHKFRSTDDLLRLTSKLGIQASKKWYYAIQLQTYTQFMRGLKSNDEKVYSDFLSPLNVNLSVGMDYKIESKNNRLTGSLNLAPLAYNFRYVDRLDIAPRFSVKEGHHSLHEFGTELTLNMRWTMLKNLTYETRLWAYTTYKRAEIEWENTFTFKLAKFLSIKAFVYPRFDDGTARDDKYGFFQFREYTSLGFSYTI